jgi:hypothetical protein
MDPVQMEHGLLNDEIMKTTSKHLHKVVLAALVSAFVLASTSSVWADYYWDARHHYRRDNYGYYDGPHYHHYVYWHNHHGYWDTRGPVRVFINVD